MFLCDSRWKRTQYFKSETNFLKKKNIFQKMEYRFLVKSTLTFPCKTTLSEVNVTANRMGSTKWTYHKKRNFASNYFIFLKIFFQSKSIL